MSKGTIRGRRINNEKGRTTFEEDGIGAKDDGILISLACKS